jgi:hypothetical protein
LQEVKIQAVEALVALGWDINTTVRELTADRCMTLVSCAAAKKLWRLMMWLLGGRV